MELVWVPAGLLEESFEAAVNVHLHMGSAASWERDSKKCMRFEAGPESLAALEMALDGC